MEGYSKRNDILSLFLMGIYALIYVVLLYLALVKTSSGEEAEGKSLFGNMQKTWSNKKKNSYCIDLCGKICNPAYFFSCIFLHSDVRR